MTTTPDRMLYPSALERRRLCPGSARVEALFPKDGKESEAARRGKLCHEGLAARVRVFGAPVSAELGEAEVKAIDYCAESVLRVYNEEKEAGNNPTILCEFSFDMRPLGFNNTYKPDCVIVTPAKLHIFEAKFGTQPVKGPQFNLQSRAYCYAGYQHFGVANIHSVVLAPLAWNEEKERECVFLEKQLRDIGEELMRIRESCMDPSAPLIPGDDQCQWCRGKETCPARRSSMEQIPAHLNVAGWFYSMAPEDRYWMMQKIILARKWCDDAMKAAETWVLAGGNIPGYTAGLSRPYKVYGDVDLAGMKLRAKAVDMGRDPAKLWETKLLSPSRVKEVLGNSKEIRELLDTLLILPDGEPKMIEDTDTRPAKKEIYGEDSSGE